MESQTNITKSVNEHTETCKRRFVASKSFDSSCECSTSRKDQENNAPTKKLDRSKTISSFNIDSDPDRNKDREVAPKEDSNNSEGSEEKTPRISLTLTVPSRTKRKDEESIDEKVARILMQSLEEIRCQKHSVHAKTSDSNQSKTTEMSQHFMKKAQAMTKSMPGTSGRPRAGPKESGIRGETSSNAGKWQALKNKAFEESTTVLRSCKHPNIKYEEVRSRTTMKDLSEDGQKGLTSPHSCHKVVQDRRQCEQLCGHLDGDASDKKEKSIEDEELLRAVLKKSMQPKGAASSLSSGLGEIRKKHDGHSEVCELGLKFLSNEIDIDQFIAGIPLERIEQDVKKLMYKHYLGTNPEAKESDSAYETLMKKKMVVSFVDNDKKSNGGKRQMGTKQNEKQQNGYCVHCGKTFDKKQFNLERKNATTNEYEGTSDDRTSYMCCYHNLPMDPHSFNLSDEEPEKVEKCLSPLDKSVATAVQTMDSFLDSERLPVIDEMNGSQLVSIISSVKHNDNCKYIEERNEIAYSKFCSCKNTNHEAIADPQKNINPPNNHSPLNKSYYSPRPVKSCIKNNFDQKNGQRSDFEGHQTGTKKNPPKEAILKEAKASKAQGTRKFKNEINVTGRDHPKEPLEVKVVDNKGNVLSRGLRNASNRSDKKTAKFGGTKKGQTSGTKYTQLFEVIPEERNTPDFPDDYERKISEPRRKLKNHNTASFGLPKQHTSKTQSISTNTERGIDYADAPKRFVSKAVETISQKSVSTMVDFEQMKREESRRNDAVNKERKHYQSKTKAATGKSERDMYMDNMKQSVDRKKGVVIGKYRPVQEKSDHDDHSVIKTKNGRPNNKESSDDMLKLSKGWINFYLVRDNNDLTDFADKDNNRTYTGYDEEQPSFTRRSVQKGTQTSDKQVQLPNLILSDSRKCYKSSSECSNISLPEIRSSSSSGPSSPENIPRSQYFRKPADTLPELGSEACVKKKKKHHFYSSGEQSNKSDSGFSREGERTTRRVEVSRSEHSISSVTSSSIVLSGSPKEGRKQKKSKSTGAAPNQSDPGSCWTVTVAGSGGTGNQAPPDVEMRLSFAGQRDDGTPRPQVLYSAHKATNLAIKSSKHHEIVEEKADSDNSLQYSSGDPVSSVTMSKREGYGRNENSGMCCDHEDWCNLKSRKCGIEDEWENERRNGVLHVTGSAITPEEKPRVPTQSERDLVRGHRYRFTR